MKSSVENFYRDQYFLKKRATTTTSGAVTVYGSTINTAINAGTSVLLDATNNITVNDNISKTTGGDATLTLKAGGNILINYDKSISSTSNKLNTVLWADSDGSGNGYISLFNNGSGSSSGASIVTNGGHLWLGGGSVGTTWNSLSVGNGYAVTTSSTGSAIALDNAKLDAGSGNVYLGAKMENDNGTLQSRQLSDIGIGYQASYKDFFAKAQVARIIGGEKSTTEDEDSTRVLVQIGFVY